MDETSAFEELEEGGRTDSEASIRGVEPRSLGRLTQWGKALARKATTAP